jgi:type II secretion system protein N
LIIQMKGKKALHAIIFVLIGILFFILFLYLGFPYESLRRRIIGELEAKTPFVYEIEKVLPHPLLGLSFKNAVISSIIGTKKVKVLEIERLRVAISLLQLIRGRISLRFWGDTLGGTVEGRLSKSGSQGKLILLGKEMNLRKLHVLRNVVGVEMVGVLRGKTALTLGGGDISRQSGTAEFTVSEVKLTKLPLPGLAPLEVGLIQGSLEMKSRNVIVKRLAFSGGDFPGEVLGNILLDAPLSQSRLNLRITVKPSAQFDPKHRVLLSLLGRRGKTEGSYGFSLRGTLGHPQIVTR